MERKVLWPILSSRSRPHHRPVCSEQHAEQDGGRAADAERLPPADAACSGADDRELLQQRLRAARRGLEAVHPPRHESRHAEAAHAVPTDAAACHANLGQVAGRPGLGTSRSSADDAGERRATRARWTASPTSTTSRGSSVRAGDPSDASLRAGGLWHEHKGEQGTPNTAVTDRGDSGAEPGDSLRVSAARGPWSWSDPPPPTPRRTRRVDRAAVLSVAGAHAHQTARPTSAMARRSCSRNWQPIVVNDPPECLQTPFRRACYRRRSRPDESKGNLFLHGGRRRDVAALPQLFCGNVKAAPA